jgi:hypothetical protein
VTVRSYYDPETGELRRRQLEARTYRAKFRDPGYDFTDTEFRWNCEDDEIDKIRSS